MNRRGFVGRIFGVLGIAAAPAVLADDQKATYDSGFDDGLLAGQELAKDKYWDAQRHINELESERGNRPLTPEQFSKEAFGSVQRHFRKTGL